MLVKETVSAPTFHLDIHEFDILVCSSCKGLEIEGYWMYACERHSYRGLNSTYELILLPSNVIFNFTLAPILLVRHMLGTC